LIEVEHRWSGLRQDQRRRSKETAMIKTAVVVAMLYAGIAAAADDRFAKCPDPEAARRYVKECQQQNPYNTQEVCEERALEKLCASAEKKG
jgi:hypothetical protein